LFSAAEALDKGLIRAIYPPDSLLEEARSLARSLVKDRSAVSTALIRQMLYRNSAAPHPLEAHYVESLAVFYTSQDDGKEGVRAFNEKRAPQFSGKASTLPAVFPWIGRPPRVE
jgi:enoyl-CoA hydratase/carnithine racemase